MSFTKHRHMLVRAVAVGVLVSACGGSTVEPDVGGSADEPTTVSTSSTTTPPSTTPTTAAPVATTAAPVATTQAATTTTTAAPADVPDVPALDLGGDAVTIEWGSLPSTPFFSPAAGGADPFFLIHTNPAEDGFFLSFEMYTTGYGAQWTGETGTFDISCADAVNSTGICPYFDPDGPGPEGALGDDFATLGSMTIVQLDAEGYEIIVHELIFSDGTTFNEFTLEG